MAASGARTLPSIGFLTVIEDVERGMTGGLLVLNAAGRPLEFHCTAPLKPNRAQEILYGPTLRPFLYGEQIGQTLLSKAKNEALFVCTDAQPALIARESVALPVVLLTASTATPTAADSPNGNSTCQTVPADDATPTRLSGFSLGRHAAAVLAEFASDRELVVERWRPYQDQWDLLEPFARIRDALAEAQRGAVK